MILCIDVPAQHGGAMTILNQYFDYAKKSREEWVFVLSTPEFITQDNIKVLNYPWVKKSWFHRLYFDYVKAPKIINELKPNEVISLQNVLVPRTKIQQTLYLHQPLPFSDIRFSLFKYPRLWVYQNIISRLIFRSIKKAKKVIVQTHWMKRLVLEKTSMDYKEKVMVEQPRINHQINEYYSEKKEDVVYFFYPASQETYKNHRAIVEALQEESLKPYFRHFKVVFTLYGNENKEIAKLSREVQKHSLPIDFIGSIPLQKVYDYYKTSILIFPSYIETFGLPLLEAKLHRTPIIAANRPFSNEILENYEHVHYFEPFDTQTLAQLILNAIQSS